MVTQLSAALTEKLPRHIELSKSRLETLALLITGMIGARTVNMSHIASERGSPERIASTRWRLQRFFQHVTPDEQSATRPIVALLGTGGPWLLCVERTKWRIGSKHVFVLVLALVTRRNRVPLVWRMLDGPGNSSTATRIVLMDHHLALFGSGSVKMLLADREVIAGDWLRYPHEDDIPFTIRMRENMTAITGTGQQIRLCTLQTRTSGARAFRAAQSGDSGHELLTLGFAVKRIRDGELLIVAASRDAHYALVAYRTQWSIE